MRLIITLLVLLFATPALAGHGGRHVFITVNGLVCDFCARSMEKVFLKKAGVHDVAVDLTSKIVTIGLAGDAALSDEDIAKGITDAGYSVVSIKRD